MKRAINLADPEFEPTDEQLLELSKRAFADAEASHQRQLRILEQQISQARKALLKNLKVPKR